MYLVKDVSKYIINYANNKGCKITNMQLQKILYFLYGYYFMDKEKELFNANFEAWAFGPVDRGVYTDYSMYGGDCIPPHNNYLNLLFNKGKPYNQKVNESEYLELFKSSDISTINIILDKLLTINPYHLVNVSKTSGGPWDICKSKKTKNNIINKKEIQNYFKYKKNKGENKHERDKYDKRFSELCTK